MMDKTILKIQVKRFLMISLGLVFLYAPLQSTNVIIISVDTLRADHLSCYGYPRTTSPNIDEFAKDGVLFMNCYTPAPLTTPAFAAMLTSLPPYKHGAKRNGMHLFKNIKILPQYLEKYGYHSGAFVSNWPLAKKKCRFHRGFHDYTEVFTKRRWLGILNVEGVAPAVNTKVFRWLNRNSGKKFFLWVLYTEPHKPYLYHKDYDFGYDETIPSAYPPGSKHRFIKKYDTEVSYDDHHIGELLKKIKQLDLYEDSIIVFMADHGESFGEHNYYRHGRKLYNSCLHVPLIVKLPGNEKAHSTIETNVSLMDIAPTIFSLLGYSPPEEMEGETLFDSGDSERILYFEAYKGAAHFRKGEKFQNKVKPIRVGLLKNDMKLILDKKVEGYDIDKDNFEINNIYPEMANEWHVYLELLKKFSAKIQEFIEQKKILKQ